MLSRLSDIDPAVFTPQNVFPSPQAWEDEVLYFVLVDRFSDGNEAGVRDENGNVLPGATPLFGPQDRDNAVRTADDEAQWRAAGTRFVGGILKGVRSKLGYLKRLGVTALWISPVLKQTAFRDTYHGYGVQDFLQIDSRYGTEQDFRDLVTAAHENEMRVVLDIILNHTGDVFAYTEGSPRWNGTERVVRGFRDSDGDAVLPFVKADPDDPSSWPGPDDAIWPVELQDPATFTREGRITNFDSAPQFRRGDFFSLKDVAQGEGGVTNYQPSPALLNLIRAYEYWIAVADLDGFRVDTVKHMDDGATRLLTARIREFTRKIGKNNFYLIGEVAGSMEFAIRTMRTTGLNAVLGIADTAGLLEAIPKGQSSPNNYFRLFQNTADMEMGSHTFLASTAVTLFDDHDQIRKGNNKARFCAEPWSERLVLAALALNATTLGIPCIYYGTEQAFDGSGGGNAADRFIREAMFGGEFGAFGSRGVHFFDETHPVYRELAKILDLRQQIPALTRGRQFLRQISGSGVTFGFPRRIGSAPMRAIVPWSRILLDHEVLCAINTDPDNATTAWVTIDAALHRQGDTLTCRYSTDSVQIGTQAAIEPRNGLAVSLTVPPAGFVIFE